VAQNPADAKVAEPERDRPRWRVWMVRRTVGGPLWGGRRCDGGGTVLNAWGAEELAEYLRAELSR
jgi:hypothetical protein